MMKDGCEPTSNKILLLRLDNKWLSRRTQIYKNKLYKLFSDSSFRIINYYMKLKRCFSTSLLFDILNLTLIIQTE